MTPIVSCLSNHHPKTDQPKSKTCKVRFSMPPEKSKKRHHHGSSRRTNSSSNASSSTVTAERPKTRPEPTPTPVKLLVVQLSSLNLNPRSEFDLAYKISTITTSNAAKQLATTLCRGDIAEISSRLAQNQSDLNDLIEVAQEQLEKAKKMERDWCPELPSKPKDYTTGVVAGKNKVMREAIQVFDELRWEYERFIKYLDWIEELKAERKHLLEDQKYMCGHFE